LRIPDFGFGGAVKTIGAATAPSLFSLDRNSYTYARPGITLPCQSLAVDKSFLCPILVGRAPIVESFKPLIERARQGQAQVVVISGEAGIGKSRLTAELKAQAAAQGFAILQGHCFEPDRTLPYAPFLDLLRSFCAAHSSKEVAHAFGANLIAQTQNAGPLLTLLPELAEHLPNVEPASPLEPEQEKRRLFQSFTNFLVGALSVRALNSTPLQVTLEDLHWCDEDSFDLLLHLTRRLAARPVLLALTYRHDELTPALQSFLAELDRARLASAEFALPRLTLNDVEAMIRAIFGQPQPVHLEFVNAIHELTEGNPFFVEETLKALVAAGDIYQGASGWARKPMAELHIPRTVQDAVQRRTHTLSPEAVRVLTLAAVAGRRFDFTLLQRLTGHDEPHLIALIKELIAAQLVIEESADVFAFRHALTRQAVYTSLLARERKPLHFTIAEMMEHLYADSLDGRLGELAYQYFEAGVWGKALGYAQRAGEKARRLYAQRAAIEHFTRAITAAQTLSAQLPLPNLFRARGGAYETLGDFDSARADYESALNVAQSSGDRRAEWQAWLDLAALWAARDYAKMGGHLEYALEAARQVADPAALAQTLNRVGNWHMNVEHFADAMRHHDEALRLFEKLNDRRGLAETHDLLAMTIAMGADPVRGMAHYEQAAKLFREMDDRGALGSVLSILGARGNIYLLDTAVWPVVSLEQRLREMEAGLSLMREVGSRPGQALATAWLGLVWATAGDYGRALDLATQAVTMAEEIGHRQFTAILHWAVGAIYLDILALAEAQAHLETSLAMAKESQAIHWVRTASGFLASTLISQNELTRAEAVLAGALRLDTPMQFNGQRHAWVALAELRLAQSRAEEALSIVEKLMATAPNVEARAEQAIPRLGLLRGQALAALGRTEEAEIILRAACETAMRYGARGVEWRVRAALGRLLRGEEAEAGKTLVEALAVSIADPALRENFVRQATASFPPSPTLTSKQSVKKQFGGLTAREREVAARVAQGKTNRAIAEELVLSERTVEKHIENIMAKLGFESRAQIAAWAVEKKLTE
jgi:DNA-binding CsgD family transcriptional regulator/tetratricopeptide (TPR) repeat protein